MATVEISVEELEMHGYFFRRYPSTYLPTLGQNEWAWGIDDQVWADGIGSLAEAAADAAEHFSEQQPAMCDRCGDQGVCPECVGA